MAVMGGDEVHLGGPVGILQDTSIEHDIVQSHALFNESLKPCSEGLLPVSSVGSTHRVNADLDTRFTSYIALLDQAASRTRL